METRNSGRKTPLVTYESVSAACESLAKNDQPVTVRRVTEVLGGGSPNMVSPFVQQWKAGKVSVKAADIAIDPRVTVILGEQVAAAVQEATKAADQRVAALEDDIGTLAEAGRHAESRAEELADELSKAQAENQQQAGRLEALASEIEQVKREAAGAIAEARNDAHREREGAEQVRQALAHANVRLEALPGLESQLEALRSQVDEERTARTASDKALALAQAELAHGQAENKRLADQLAANAQELAEVRQEAGAAVAAARAQEQAAAVARAEQQAAERRADDARRELDHAREEARGYQVQIERGNALMAKLQEEATQAQQQAAAAREEAASLRGQLGVQGKASQSETGSGKPAAKAGGRGKDGGAAK